MAIQCPYCQNALGVKAAKPGRFTTRCPRCDKKLLLTVPQDPAGTPTVASIPSEAAPAPTPTAATLARGPSAATDDTVAGPAASAPAPTAAMLSSQDTVPGPTEASRAGSPSAETRSAAPGATAATAARGFDAAPPAADPADAGPPMTRGMPATLGGYQVLKELGRGGMGAVYLARQMSLDRNVALKVMRPDWAGNPAFVSRFTREAYAAAQLVHHNVVQIYDFGQDRGTSYFSMEYVPGQTLSHLLNSQRKLDVDVAVGYILQAARGLKYAHDQSMVHRDIKPDNLLLNDQGVVKVADLGLVKTPAVAEVEEARESKTTVVPTRPGPSAGRSSEGAVTMAGVAMGTPAFMAPEQARDAASVDRRADIYSLGCTLYDLVTGRPPFEGSTAYELMTKHQSEPVVPPEMIVKRVPKALSDIILKMVAKKPDDRYSDLGDVIKALEGFLGLPGTGVFSPREEHANLLQECAERFNAAPTARKRPWILLTGAAACALVVVAAVVARQPFLAGGFLGLGLMTALAYFVVNGVTRKTYLFLKAREFVLSSRPFEWLMALVGLVLFVTILVVTHLVLAWIAFGIVAVLMAVGMHVVIDRRVDEERREAIESAEGLLKRLRLHGIDEEALRQFVCKYSGERWEEFFEELFGYESKLAARDLWGRGDRGRLRRTYGAWRDPILRWIDAKQQERRQARETRLLQKIEEKGLEAKGVNLATARRHAKRSAEAMVTMAAEIREAERLPAAVRGERLAIGRAMRDAAAKPEMVLVDREHGLIGPRPAGPLNLILGPGPRFLAGALLLTGCLLWMHQNQMLTREKLEEARAAAKQLSAQAQVVATEAVKAKDVRVLNKARESLTQVELPRVPERARPLRLPMLPPRAAALFHSFGPGVAGLILLVSSLVRGFKISLFVVPAAAIAWLGPELGPGLGGTMSAWIGVGLGVLGLIFGRSR